MKKIIRNFFIGLGVLTFFAMIMGGITVYKLTSGSVEPLPEKFLVITTLDQPLSDDSHFSFELGDYTPTIQDYTNTLTRVAQDERIDSLYVRLKTPLQSISYMQELTAALDTIKASGKQTYLYTETLPNLTTAAFASSFDHVWLMPTGTGAMSGVSMEVPYFKKALDLVGITAEFSRREAYKSAPESFIMETPTAESKEALTNLSQDLYQQLIAHIKAHRPDVKIMESAQLTDTELLESGLVDKLAYLDEFIAMTEEKSTQEKLPQISLGRYITSYNHEQKDTLEKAPHIAQLTLNGMIIDPSMHVSGQASLGQEAIIDPYTIQEALHEIAKNDEIKAVLIRLNSPGGSPTGSEVIRRAIQEVKASGKKVYISMSQMAASGGYWMSVNADTIYAAPSSLTGSIGVYGGKFTLNKLWDKLGINWQSFHAGALNTMLSHHHTLSKEDRASLEKMMDDIYQKFLTRVAEGRNIPVEDLKSKLAGGRIWTGQAAKEVGLVDHIGGVQETVTHIKTDMGLAPEDTLAVTHYPKARTPIEEILSMLDGFFAQAFALHTNLTQAKSLFAMQEASTLDPMLISY